jgi:4-amino-4-deoxychorismate lyase
MIEMKFLESIRVSKRIFENLGLHQNRVKKVFEAYFPTLPVIDLFSIQIPSDLDNGLYKCRVIYTQKIEQVEFVPHQIKSIHSLCLVEGNHIDYSHKLAQRDALQALYQRRKSAEDVLIVRDGLITDTSYGNIAFWDGQQWFTPHPPLLEGTQRSKLIKSEIIFSKEIKVTDLSNFYKFKIFNALRVWEEVEEISIENIFE